MSNQEKLRLSECLWVDLKTHEQKRDFLLLGRGVDTGIIAPAMQNVLAHDYNIIVELKKDNAELNQRIVELEAYLQKVQADRINDIAIERKRWAKADLVALEILRLEQQAKGIIGALDDDEITHDGWISVEFLKDCICDLQFKAKALKEPKL
jgi:hypothetical protein